MAMNTRERFPNKTAVKEKMSLFNRRSTAILFKLRPLVRPKTFP